MNFIFNSSKYGYASIDAESDFQPFDLTPQFQDGGHDVISGRKVLQAGECTCMQRQPGVHASASPVSYP